jgi:ubiquinone/menaquinone biosynthesis C-methylase UbiE
MDHFRHIYAHRAADYHRLITPEDCTGNLLPAMQRVTDFRDKRVVDLGTGTGRLPLLLSEQAAQVIGLDLHGAMLQENQRQRGQVNGRWGLTQGDMCTLPFLTGWADVVTAAWCISHLRTWYADDWQRQIGRVLREMHRVLAPDGAMIIIETLTTGSLTPAPPTPALAEYYAWLEGEWGFVRQTIRTDYQFATVEEAVRRTEFFFGEDLAMTIRAQGWVQLPEWTGVWRKKFGPGNPNLPQF